MDGEELLIGWRQTRSFWSARKEAYVAIGDLFWPAGRSFTGESKPGKGLFAPGKPISKPGQRRAMVEEKERPGNVVTPFEVHADRKIAGTAKDSERSVEWTRLRISMRRR